MTDIRYTAGLLDQTAPGFTSVTRRAQESGNAINRAFTFLRTGALYYGLLQLRDGFRVAIETGLEVSKIEARFRAATGSVDEANAAMGRMREMSVGLGQRFLTSAGSMGMFLASVRGTKLEGEKAENILRGVNTAATALGISTDDVSGILRAFTQMVSKGTVASEELKGQVGERLPGAFRIAAESMGLTTTELAKMLEQGKVAADDFLPKFSAALESIYSDEAKARLTSLQADLNAIGNWWDGMKMKVSRGLIEPGISEFRNLVAPSVQGLEQEMAARRFSMGIGDNTTKLDTAILHILSPIQSAAQGWAQIQLERLKAAENAERPKNKGFTAGLADMEALNSWSGRSDLWDEETINHQRKVFQEVAEINQRRAQETKRAAEEMDRLNESTMTASEKQLASFRETEAALNKLVASGRISAEVGGEMGQRWAYAFSQMTREAETFDDLMEQQLDVSKEWRDQMMQVADESLQGFQVVRDQNIEAMREQSEFAREASREIFSAFNTMFMNIGTGASSFKDDLINAFRSVLAAGATRQLFSFLGQLGSDLSVAGSNNSATGGWSWVKSALGAALSIFGSEKGNAFGVGGPITAFANGGVVTSPTMFTYGGGRLGVMAEREPEVVMPLARTRNGRMGVEAIGAGGKTVLNYHAGNTYINGSNLSQQQLASAMKQAHDASVATMMRMRDEGRYP